MQADLWGWFNRSLHDAIMKGDVQREQLARLHDRMWLTMEVDTQASLGCVLEAIEIAKRLNEPCWLVFHEYWHSELLMFYLKNYPAGMENAVKTVVEARKPQYQQCPVLGRVYRMLFDTYLIVDPLGYEDEIYETITYMENDIAMDSDTAQLLVERKAEMALEKGDLETALAETLKYLEVSQYSSFRKSDAYLLLAFIRHYQKDYEQALELTREAELWSNRSHRQTGMRNAFIWLAMLEQRLGQTEAAAQHYRMGMAKMKALSVQPSGIFYEAACVYQELVEQHENALALRDRQLEEVLATKGSHGITTTRLKRARLLGRMGMMEKLQEEVAEAKEAAKGLRKPQYFLEKLAKVENGDYSETL